MTGKLDILSSGICLLKRIHLDTKGSYMQIKNEQKHVKMKLDKLDGRRLWNKPVCDR